MPDIVKLNKKSNIIEIESIDVVSKEDIENSFKKMEELYKKHNANKILVDTTKQKQLPTITDLINIFAKLDPVFISALYYNKSQLTATNIQFIETVSVNRGKILKCFTEKESALEWLQKKG